MARNLDLPSRALTVTRYRELRKHVRGFAQGNTDLLIIVGDGGIGKSRTVKKTMDSVCGKGAWGLLKGRHSALDFYGALFAHRTRPVVLDDLDGLLRIPENVALMKAVCETEAIKTLEWGSTSPALVKHDPPLPPRFDSTSQICLVANDLKTSNRDHAALFDRGIVLHFQPTAVEVHRQVASGRWFDDEEVFGFIGRHLHLVDGPSFRLYKHALSLKATGVDWRRDALKMMSGEADPKLLLVARLLDDASYDARPKPEEARVKAFQRQGGGSRATYFRRKEALLERRDSFNLDQVARIRLKPRRSACEDRATLALHRELEAPGEPQGAGSRAPQRLQDSGESVA